MSKTKSVAEIVPVVETGISNRTPEIIATEINSIKDQTVRVFFFNSIEIGRKLVEAKEYVEHGGWATWLKESVDFSQSTANNHMKMFAEYGADQISLFGANVKSQVFANLSYSQAVALLSLPAEEREEFVENNDVENKSVRELQQAIKDKQEAERLLSESLEREKTIKAQEVAAKAARELVSKRLVEVEQEVREAEEEKQRLEAELELAKSSEEEKPSAKSKTELRKAEKATSDAQVKLEALELKMKNQQAEQEKAITERLQQREQELQAASTQKEIEHKEQLDKLNQQLSRSNNEAFLKAKMQLQQIIDQGDVLVKAIAEVTDPEEQSKLKAVAGQVIDKLRALL